MVRLSLLGRVVIVGCVCGIGVVVGGGYGVVVSVVGGGVAALCCRC